MFIVCSSVAGPRIVASPARRYTENPMDSYRDDGHAAGGPAPRGIQHTRDRRPPRLFPLQRRGQSVHRPRHGRERHGGGDGRLAHHDRQSGHRGALPDGRQDPGIRDIGTGEKAKAEEYVSRATGRGLHARGGSTSAVIWLASDAVLRAFGATGTILSEAKAYTGWVLLSSRRPWLRLWRPAPPWRRGAGPGPALWSN